ncbi:alpha/beta hydrolase family protein [Saccharothrix carnea]|uniref:Alpha/beta hydrolase family protein n=2 Tax=Saccharothrix carnea TaxID=1280637 RepID=A0A2P8IJB9_SACCR|nr:alpha/beta hydrolase family protein [Saccharothrix carnea]
MVAALLVLATPGGGDPPPFTPRVEVHGDLARAAHVAVVVPGSDVDGPRFGATVGRMARHLHASVGRDDVAVVAWLGYRTPSGLGVDAAGGRLARAGAVALDEYVRTLPGHVHLLCHSYGSVVCALAQPRVDDVVFLGSPGVRVDAVTSGARVWAARGGRDWTRWVPSVRLGDLGHGVDPVDPAFGARVFDAGDVEHDEYFREGTPSLRALARIAVGEAP